MKNTKKKFFFFRMVTMMMAVLSLAVVMAFPVSASAAEAPAAVSTAVEIVPLPAAANNAVMQAARFIPPILPKMEGEVVEGGGSLGSQTNGDTQFQAVVEFFAKWIKRVGLLVAFVGAVMFGLAIKNNDAEQKQGGLLTLVAGFVVAAVCQAIDMFGIFT